MSRLLIVSNRLPVNVKRDGNGYKVTPSVGGLATGLGAFHASYQSLWIGWPGITLETKEKPEAAEAACRREGCIPVFLTRHEEDQYYNGFCNKTIWPLFHYFNQYTQYKSGMWEMYKRVNRAFCDTVCRVAEPDDIIWIHDYHLMLLPRMIRERMPYVAMGFFLHIPFPSFEVFRQLPWREEIIEGLLGCDLIGFHTYDYVRHFHNCVRGHFGYEYVLGQIPVGNRIVKVDAFPMGIDYKRYVEAVDDAKVKQEARKIREKVGDRKILLSIDRLDYSKGIPQRLEAYTLFLERYPEYRGKVTYILVAVPSRTRVGQYALLKRQVDELVGRVNGRFGTFGWIPVWYLYRSFPFKQLMGLYAAADIALVTPLRDGMNLVAKEFIAAKRDGRAIITPSSHHVRVIAALVRGDHEINEAKLARVLGVSSLAMASESTIRRATDAEVGFAGPMRLIEEGKVDFLVIDHAVAAMPVGVTGANKTDHHTRNVVPGRDFPLQTPRDLERLERDLPCPIVQVADIRNAVQGDSHGGKPLKFSHGIEVGHVFKLGTKYSAALGATFLDAGGKELPCVMGCYGIGINRILAAAIEIGHDDNGCILPISIAPYEVEVLAINVENERVAATAERIHDELVAAGVEVLLDDRRARPGVKFKDADLIGIPLRIVVGERGIKAGSVEIKRRTDEKPTAVPIDGAVAEALRIVREMKDDLRP